VDADSTEVRAEHARRDASPQHPAARTRNAAPCSADVEHDAGRTAQLSFAATPRAAGGRLLPWGGARG